MQDELPSVHAAHAASDDDVDFVADSEDEGARGPFLLTSNSLSQLSSLSQSSVRTNESLDIDELPTDHPQHALPTSLQSQPEALTLPAPNQETAQPMEDEDETLPLPNTQSSTQIEVLPLPNTQSSTQIETLPQSSLAPMWPSQTLEASQSRQPSPSGSHLALPILGQDNASNDAELAEASPQFAGPSRTPTPTPSIAVSPSNVAPPQRQYDITPSSSPPLAPLQMPQRGVPGPSRLVDAEESALASTTPPLSPRPAADSHAISDEAAARAAAALPPTPPQRQFRARKAQQLNPYTLEALKYQRTLIRNDWQDAVVSQREWHRQERRRIAEEEAKTRAANGQDPQAESQSQWLVNSSGPSSDADPDEAMLDPSQFSPSNRHRRATSPPERPGTDRLDSPPSPLLSTRPHAVSQRRRSPVAGPSNDRSKTYKGSRTLATSAERERVSLLGASSDSDSAEAATVRRKRHLRASSASIGDSQDVINNGDFPVAIESSEDERPPPPKAKPPRRSRWSGDGSSDDSTDYERRFRQLKKMMPAGMARKHIRDLRAMRHGKRYHSDGHISSASSVHTDGSATAGDVTMTSARLAGETPTTSPQEVAGELRPGQTRKRLRRHDSLASNDALLLDADSESSSSSDDSVVEVGGAQPPSESETDQPAWWTADKYTSRAEPRERDAIDRMLSRTTGRRRPSTNKPRKKAAQTTWQERLDGFVSSTIPYDWDRPTVLREKDSNIRRPRKSAGAEGGDKARSTKKRRYDPRVGQTRRHYLGPSIASANPPVVRPRTRPRLDLHYDDVLFARNPNKQIEEQDNMDSDYDLALLVHQISDEQPAAAVAVQARLAQPRKPAPSNHANGFLSPNGAATRERFRDIAITSPQADAPRYVDSPRLPQQQVLERSAKRDVDIHPDAEQWDDFQGIRMDFDILKFPVGVCITSSATLLQDGYLSTLVALPDQLIQGDVVPLPWSDTVLRLDDVTLTINMDVDAMQSTLGAFCDRLRSEISGTLASDIGSEDIGLRRLKTILSDTRLFLCCWLMQQNANDPRESTGATFRAYRCILTRVDTLQTSLLTSIPSARLKDVSLQLCWLRLELCWRALAVSDTHPSNALETEAPTVDELLMFSRTLMSLLLYHGLHKSMRTLRRTRESEASESASTPDEASTTDNDESASMWIALIHLLTSFERSRGIVDGNLFWSQFELAFDKWDKTLVRKEALIRAESLWYCLFALTSLSHFSEAGESKPVSYLRQSWNLVVKALACIRLRLDEQVEAKMTWHSLAKRDSYIRILLQRCCLLTVEWKWGMDGSDAAIARLFDIFNSHKLSDLPTESDHDFPGFLRDFDVRKLDLTAFRGEEANREPCYQLFVKLLARAGLENRASAKDEREGDRRISRLFSRMTPVRVMPFTRANVPTSSERSVLFNHYAVVMLFLHLVPSSSSQRLRQIQSFLPSFSNADFLSQVTCIRAMMYAAVLFRHHQLDVAPVTKWFGETMTTLLQEYNELDKTTGLYDRQQQQKQAQGKTGPDDGALSRMAPVFANAPGRQASLQRQQEVTRLLVTALRSTQHVIRHSDLNSEEGRKARLPDLHLLHPSWTKNLLEAQLAIEPLIGQEALKCIQTFLLARIAALAPPRGPAAQEESQDSFGELFEVDDDFDFEDPLLAKLLDGQPTTGPGRALAETADEPASANRQWDREFSQYVKDTISPSLFQLLSNIYHPDRRSQQDVFTLGVTERITDQRFDTASSTAGGARSRMAMLMKVAERRKYLELVVDCWAGCGHVLVANGLREWSSYLGFGNESWKRIDDPIGRRDVGLRFLQNVLSLDPKTAGVREYESEYVAVWVQTAVARVLSIQDVFTTSLLARGADGKLLGGLTQRWRTALLPAPSSQPGDPPQLDLEEFPRVRGQLLGTTFEWLVQLSTTPGSASTVYSSLSALLSSLRVYVEDTPAGDTTATAYFKFCRHTLATLHDHIHTSPVFTAITHEYENTLAVITKRLDAAAGQ